MCHCTALTAGIGLWMISSSIDQYLSILPPDGIYSDTAQSSEFGDQIYCPTVQLNAPVRVLLDVYFLLTASWIVFLDGLEKCRTIVPFLKAERQEDCKGS